MNLELFPQPTFSLAHFEDRARKAGFRAVAGVDEAGRGPLAGPVVAAAVILPDNFDLPGLNDSKQVAPKERQRLFLAIRRQALAIGLGVVQAAEIDHINILQATLKGMSMAVRRLKIAADYLLVDGITPVPLAIRQITVKQGDSRSFSIAAASIVAKVVRDRMMAGYDRRFPGYGFAAHKGYGCASHLDAIARLGPSPLHRLSFSGVREHADRRD